MSGKFTFILAVVFYLTTFIFLHADLAPQNPSPSNGSGSVTYAMTGPDTVPKKLADPSYSLPEKNSWDKQWIKQEFDKGAVKFMFKDMIGEKGFQYFTLSNPPRIVFDIKDPKHLPPSPWYKLPLKGWAFNKMRVGTYPDKVRFVLDLSEEEFLIHTVYTEGADLIVKIGPFSKIFQANDNSSSAAKPPSADKPLSPEKPPSAATAVTPPSHSL